MKAPRIFQSTLAPLDQTIDLSADAGQHVGVVLRMQPGEHLILFCGDNRECLAEIIAVHKKRVTVKGVTMTVVNRESPRAIHLAQSISKGDRMEWIIQKAVELGVYSITPLMTARCVVRLDEERLAKKQQQWQAIAVSACEQSGRNRVPEIYPAISFDHYIQHTTASIKLILHPRSTITCRELCLTEGDVTLLIGPEGGLSDEEVSAAQRHQFQALALGPRILRTETATIAALSILQAMGGDL